MSVINISTIEDNIKEIRSYLQNDRPFSLDLWDYPESKHEQNPSYKWGYIIEKNLNILDKFSSVSRFLNPQQIKDFLSYTENLKGFLNDLNRPLTDLDKDTPPKPVPIPSIHTLSPDYHPYDVTELLNLLDSMHEKEIDFDTSSRIKFLLLEPNLTQETIYDIGSILTKFYNSKFEQNPKKANELYTEASLGLHHLEIKEELAKAKSATQEITELSNKAARDLGLPISENLITRYKTEYKLLDCPIKRLSIVIFSIFIILLVSIGIAFFIIIINNNLPDLSKVYFLYLSFMLVATGLLTYCVRERSRLVSIRHKLMISYLELISLSDYMLEFSSTDRVSLRKHLADRYFQGPNNPPHETNNFNLISENLNQLSKVIADLKSAIK